MEEVQVEKAAPFSTLRSTKARGAQLLPPLPLGEGWGEGSSTHNAQRKGRS